MTTRDRRLKILTVSKDHVLAFLSWKPGQTLFVPVHLQLPDDAEVMDVVYDWERQSFGLLVRHETFPLVDDGCQLPWVSPPTFWCEADVVRELDDVRKIVAMYRPGGKLDPGPGGYFGVPAELVPALEAMLREEGQVRGRDYTINGESDEPTTVSEKRP